MVGGVEGYFFAGALAIELRPLLLQRLLLRGDPGLDVVDRVLVQLDEGRLAGQSADGSEQLAAEQYAAAALDHVLHALAGQAALPRVVRVGVVGGRGADADVGLVGEAIALGLLRLGLGGRGGLGLRAGLALGRRGGCGGCSLRGVRAGGGRHLGGLGIVVRGGRVGMGFGRHDTVLRETG
jgi:hypothetical protein